MFKKILPPLILFLGVVFLLVRPLSLQTGLKPLLPTQGREDFGKYPNFEHQERMYVLLSQEDQDIFNPVFMKVLRDTTNDIFFLPGVDRSGVISLTAHDVNYRDIIEDGFDGGPIISEDFTYENEGYAKIKQNLLKSRYVGQLVAYDFKSAIIVVPFYKDTDPKKLAKQIDASLPKNNAIKHAILGHVPFLLSLQNEIKRSLLILLVTWLVACLLYYILIRRFAGALVIAPLMTVVVQLTFYRFLTSDVHPFVLPVVIFTMILAFIDRVWQGLNEGEGLSSPAVLVAIALMPVAGLYFLNTAVGLDMTRLCLTGALALLITHKIYLPKSKPSKKFTPVDFNTGPKSIMLLLLLIVGLALASTTVVGNPGHGISMLRQNSDYQKHQQFMSDHYAFTADSMLLPTFASGEGCTDIATVKTLDELNWFLTDFRGVRSVWSLSEGVKAINMFLHEDNLKWRSIPEERDTLLSTTSNLDPDTGLLDETCRTLPVHIFMEDHDPSNINRVYDGIKKFKFSSDLLSLKIGGGLAAFEAMHNETLSSSVKWVLLAFLGIMFLATRLILPWRATIAFCFTLCVLLSLALALAAITSMGLNMDTVVGITLGTSMCSIILWLYLYYPSLQHKLFIIVFLTTIVISGGLFSEINFIFKASVIAEWMLVLTWLVGFNAFKAEANLPDSPAGT